MNYPLRLSSSVSSLVRRLSLVAVATAAISLTVTASASLPAYDDAVAADIGTGLNPLARLTNSAVLNGSTRVAYNFGANSGDVTMEFVLTGNPSFGSGSSFIAVGANTASSLRYNQWQNTGQLGFTQGGVADYLFNPGVPSPQAPVHITYVWQSGSRTMRPFSGSGVWG